MFGIVANIVIALCRTLFGITNPSAGVTQLGNSVTYFEVDTGNARLDSIIGGNWLYKLTTTSLELAGGIELRWANAASNLGSGNDTGLKRAAAGVLTATNGVGTASGWLQSPGGRARMTANVTENAASLTNLTDLSVTLIAGRKYTGRLVLKLSDSTAAEGVKIDFAGGAATMTSFAAAAGILAGGTAVLVNAVSSALATVINWSTITGETWVVIELSMVVNAGGTFIPRVAQNSHAAGTLTANLGSYLWLDDSPN